MSWPTFWEQKKWQSYLLLPLSKLVCWEARRRYNAFENSPKQTSATVIVVGNVVVGGTGKTPFIIWLSKQLKAQGYRVGIISRGYGVKVPKPIMVDEHTTSKECGDEPLMLFKQTACPVVVSPKRTDALATLTKHKTVDFVISDDGLQHYALARDIEIVLIDSERQFGNGLCLPSGPLRESIERIADVDFTVWNGLTEGQEPPMLEVEQKSAQAMQLNPVKFCQVGNPEIVMSMDEFKERYSSTELQAVAGIGNPQRFFDTLSQLGFITDNRPFPDHHAFSPEDFDTSGNDNQSNRDSNNLKPVVMTEKDAVKCLPFAKSQPHWWYLQVEACSDAAIVEAVVTQHLTQR